jgi:hypothetical protein
MSCLSCSDGMPTPAGELNLRGGAKLLGEVHCTATTQLRTLDCSSLAAAGVGQPNHALLGANQVKLRSSNVRYDTTTLIFGFDVNMTNLLTERIGTPDGVTLSGLKVFYDSVADSASDHFLIPADSVAKLYAARRAVSNNPRMGNAYPRDIVLIAFRAGTPSEELQAAINLVGGSVIGGYAHHHYIVKLASADSAGNALWSAIDRLRSLPQVEQAYPDLLFSTRLNYTLPNDGPGWQKADWQLEDSLAFGSKLWVSTLYSPTRISTIGN